MSLVAPSPPPLLVGMMPDSLTTPRKWLFEAILALIVVCVPLLLLEIALRILGVEVSDDPYLQFGRVEPFLMRRQLERQDYYQAANREIYNQHQNFFKAKKDPGTFRVFCLGSSASAGWPHPYTETYSAYLQEALHRAYPQRKIEVLSLGAHAYAAYRTRMIFNEVLGLEPDLFIIYEGNNEFVERRVYSTETHWFDPLIRIANRSSLFRILRGSEAGRHWFPTNTLKSDERGHADYEMWSKLEQLPLDLRKDPDQFQRVKEHYAYNIERMVKDALAESVPVILLTSPVNLRDWRPNVSYQALQGEALATWQMHYTNGRGALFRGDADAAIRELRLASALAPLHAETYFYLARAFEAKGQFEEALRNYNQARDMDYNPFRAISAFNADLRQIAARHNGVQLADADAAFQLAVAPQAPGFDLFLDYVHPTRRGNLIIAKLVFDQIVERRLIGGGAATDEFSHNPKLYPCNRKKGVFVGAIQCPSGYAPYDDMTDFPMQGMLVRLFSAMHQYESVVAKLTYLLNTPGALDSLSNDSTAFASKAFVKDAMSVYSRLLELERREYSGVAVQSTEGMIAQENLQKFKRKYFKGYDEFKKKYLSSRAISESALKNHR
jgi:hypothetical protein